MQKTFAALPKSWSIAAAGIDQTNFNLAVNGALVSQDFGYYIMSSGAIQNQIRTKTYGTALMQINIGELRKFVVPFPPLSGQEAIMGTLDGLREETQRLESLYQRKLAALDALKKSLLHRAFTGQL